MPYYWVRCLSVTQINMLTTRDILIFSTLLPSGEVGLLVSPHIGGMIQNFHNTWLFTKTVSWVENHFPFTGWLITHSRVTVMPHDLLYVLTKYGMHVRAFKKQNQMNLFLITHCRALKILCASCVENRV